MAAGTKTKTKVIDEDIVEGEEDMDDEEDMEPQQSLKDKAKEATAPRRRKEFRRSKTPKVQLVREGYDPEEDWEVSHSGSTDPNGVPKYDESPVPGGMIITSGAFAHTEPGEIVNSKGHEIDPDELDNNGVPVVLDPDRYKDSEPDFGG